MPPASATQKSKTKSAPLELTDLTVAVQRSEGFADMIAALRNGRSATIDGAWGSAAPLAIAALAWHSPKPILAVIPQTADLEDFAEDLASFSGLEVETLPAWDRPPDEAGSKDEAVGRRLRVIRRLIEPHPPRLIVAPIAALMQPVPTPEALERASKRLEVGGVVRVEDLSAWLIERGMSRVEVVEVPGEFSLRGGILDLFPPDRTEPVRVELFGDEIESIRPFDAESQRSLGALERVTITTASAGLEDHPGHAAALLPEGSWVALVEPEDLKRQGRAVRDRFGDGGQIFAFEESFKRLIEHPSITVSAVAAASLETTCRLSVESVERFSGDPSRIREELEAVSGTDRVLIACRAEAELRRLEELFDETAPAKSGRIAWRVGRVRSGFRLVEAGLVLITDHELFDRTEVKRAPRRRRYESRAIDSFLDLNEGDLVVHVSHGIARYRGLQLVEKAPETGHVEEQLVLEFAQGARLYVPIAKIELVQKYVGGGKTHPPLSRIGSSAWERKKKRVAEAVADLAADLIDIQAKRAASPGFAFPAEDGPWLAAFEAAFPFDETPDQLSAIEAVKADMSRPKPMDRLLCGDVGYGKTEVAMRAAFKAVEAGKQVAVLVPTTVLAEQHLRTFSERMGEFPLRIEAISRFRPKREIKRVLEDAAAGKVDVLIGTHRLVQKDVAFRDLGLVIIDEEQRFGVADKEWLKSLRATVDVATLSATPIPRTLHMALLGLRDIANLETPPPDRKAIETRITRWDDRSIREAILRELNRGGQVFFVHNRVYDLASVADRIVSLVPEARVVTAHGQMSGEELERAMIAFVRGEADVLVATTIIESGLDIPNANTIFIHEADRHGLADLHQLRGRVGRSKNRAYAYMIVDSSKPLAPNALKRLKAIEEFTDLGAGFKIALRDLEIRGAGNLLGAEQSGHIEAVGYELYCSLLESAVAVLSGKRPRDGGPQCSVELPWRAYLPADYVPSHTLKIELYRRLARVRRLDRLEDLGAELADRFGPPPEPAANLLAEHELRILGNAWRLDRLRPEDGYLVLTYRDESRVKRLAKHHPGRVRIVDDSNAYVPMTEGRNADAATIAETARALLRQPPKAQSAPASRPNDRPKSEPPALPAGPPDRSVPLSHGLRRRTSRSSS